MASGYQHIFLLGLFQLLHLCNWLREAYCPCQQQNAQQLSFYSFFPHCQEDHGQKISEAMCISDSIRARSIILRAAFQNELTWIVSLLRNRCFLISCAPVTLDWNDSEWAFILVWCKPEARFNCFFPGRKHKNHCGIILQNGHLCLSLTFALYSYRLFSTTKIFFGFYLLNFWLFLHQTS